MRWVAARTFTRPLCLFKTGPPRHRRRQRQLDRALVNTAAQLFKANERLAHHHGSASLPMATCGQGRNRCMDEDCMAMRPHAEPAATYIKACTRCFTPNTTNAHLVPEELFQELNANGAFAKIQARLTGNAAAPDTPARPPRKGKGKGSKGRGKGNGQKGGGTSKASKGTGKNGKDQGKTHSPVSPTYSVQQRKLEQEKKASSELRKNLKETQDQLDALRKPGAIPVDPKPADLAPDEPKISELTMCDRSGNEVLVVVTCPCAKQHWARPRNGNCVRCKQPLPAEDKQPPPKKQPRISHHARQTCDMLTAAAAPVENQAAQEERAQKVTKLQAVIDQAISAGSGQVVIEAMKAELEQTKAPVAPHPQCDTYTVKVRTSESLKEQIKFWGAQVKKFDVRASHHNAKVKAAKEAFDAEIMKLEAINDEHIAEEAEHDKVMKTLSDAETHYEQLIQAPSAPQS